MKTLTYPLIVLFLLGCGGGSETTMVRLVDVFDGEAVEGVDRIFEATGDFVSAIFRVMPHGSEPERFKRITEQMQSVKIAGLAEHRGEPAKTRDEVAFPPVGETDADVFENNLLEVMQFVFNHTTFDPENPMDSAVLDLYKPLGVEPGKVYDPVKVATIDGSPSRPGPSPRRHRTEFAAKATSATTDRLNTANPPDALFTGDGAKTAGRHRGRPSRS